MKKLSLILLCVIMSSCSFFNGHGSLSGNCYWKYNDYVGNKADAGAEIELYSLDDMELKYKVTADLNGNYKIEEVPVGKYFLIIHSKNTTDCPRSHLDNLSIYNDKIKLLFGFDIKKYKAQLNEIEKLDSLSNYSLFDKESTDDYYKYEKLANEKAIKLIESFPKDFKNKIKLYTGYSYTYDFSTITIEKDKNINVISDFGITCI